MRKMMATRGQAQPEKYEQNVQCNDPKCRWCRHLSGVGTGGLDPYFPVHPRDAKECPPQKNWPLIYGLALFLKTPFSRVRIRV